MHVTDWYVVAGSYISCVSPLLPSGHLNTGLVVALVVVAMDVPVEVEVEIVVVDEVAVVTAVVAVAVDEITVAAVVAVEVVERVVVVAVVAVEVVERVVVVAVVAVEVVERVVVVAAVAAAVPSAHQEDPLPSYEGCENTAFAATDNVALLPPNFLPPQPVMVPSSFIAENAPYVEKIAVYPPSDGGLAPP